MGGEIDATRQKSRDGLRRRGRGRRRERLRTADSATGSWPVSAAQMVIKPNEKHFNHLLKSSLRPISFFPGVFEAVGVVVAEGRCALKRTDCLIGYSVARRSSNVVRSIASSERMFEFDPTVSIYIIHYIT